MKSLKHLASISILFSASTFAGELPGGVYEGVVVGEYNGVSNNWPVVVDFDKGKIWDGSCIYTQNIQAGSTLENFHYSTAGCGHVDLDCSFSDGSEVLAVLKHDGVIVCHGTLLNVHNRSLYLTKSNQTALMR